MDQAELDEQARFDARVAREEREREQMSAFREVAAAARDVADRDRETYVPPVLLARLDAAVDRLRRTIGDVAFGSLRTGE